MVILEPSGAPVKSRLASSLGAKGFPDITSLTGYISGSAGPAQPQWLQSLLDMGGTGYDGVGQDSMVKASPLLKGRQLTSHVFHAIYSLYKMFSL